MRFRQRLYLSGLSALAIGVASGPGMGMMSAASAAPRGLVFSTAGTPSGCDPVTNPNCVCDGSTCMIVVPITPPPVDPGPGPVDPEPPGPPGGPPGDPGPGDPPPIALPPPGEIWEPCAIGQPPPPGFVCPAPGEPAPDPGEPLPPPPTEAEILELVAQLDLPAPEIGSAPCSGPGCMGAVGLPVWLWTQPWQTYSDTAAVRVYEVTLTATPAYVDWTLGDGTVLRCGEGTPYLVSYGIVESPTCGHIYERTSADLPGQAYTLTGRFTWDVSWSGVVSGSTTTTTEQSVPVRIGEYQTVITYAG